MTTPDTPKSVNSVTLFVTRCRHCLSTGVLLEANLEWSLASQAWIHSSDSGEFYCCECNIANVDTDQVPIQQAVQDLKDALSDLRAWVELADVSIDVDDEDSMHYLRERMVGELAELETYL